jgi:hypothetical protein
MPNNYPHPSPAAFSSSVHTHLQTAIEKASAPGLSLNERFHALMDSVYTPDLSLHEQHGDAALTNAQRKILALRHFKNTPQYQAFKSVISHTLRELDAIANSTRPEDRKNTHFQDLDQGLWQEVKEDTTSRFGIFQTDLYQQACPDANRLVRLHAFAQQRPDLVSDNSEENARTSIQDLSERLHLCGPGLVQHFEEAVRNVRQATFTLSLPERFEALRIQIARNAIAEFVTQHPDPMGHAVGNEVHKVAAWQNYFSQVLSLPRITDIFASPRFVENQNHCFELSIKLRILQTRSVVSRVMATQILEEAHDLWHQAQAGGTTDLARGCMAIIEKISNKHGPVEPHTLFQMNDEGMPCKLHDNPTLLALCILRQIENSTCVNTCQERLLHNRLNHPGGENGLELKSLGSLCWLEKPVPGMAGEPEQQLVSSQNLSAAQIQELFDSLLAASPENMQARVAMHELLRNEWGAQFPVCKIHDFDLAARNDVFVNLAIGLAKDLPLGQLEVNPKYEPVLLKALDNLHKSQILKHHHIRNIYHLLDYSNTFDGIFCNGESALKVPARVNSIASLQDPDVNVRLYWAAVGYNWRHHPDQSARQTINNPAFTAAKPVYGNIYLQIMAGGAPRLLSKTLCENILTIRHPEIVVKFFQACAQYNFNESERDRALILLVQRNDDAFVTTVLRNLAERGVSLRVLADPRVVGYLRSKNMMHSANELNSRLRRTNSAPTL